MAVSPNRVVPLNFQATGRSRSLAERELLAFAQRVVKPGLALPDEPNIRGYI